MTPEKTTETESTPAWIPLLLTGLAVVAFFILPLVSDSASIQGDAADLTYPMQRYFGGRFGSPPFWTPYLYSGYPFLANAQAGAWYPLNWPFYLTTVTGYTIQLELALHAGLACLGAYLFFKRLVGRVSAAVVGAFAYGLSGYFVAATSHPEAFAAAAWLPWLMLGYRRAADSKAAHYSALAAVAGAMMVLAGHPETAAFGFLGTALYSFTDIRRYGARPLKIGAAIMLGSLGLAAIQLVPALELQYWSEGPPAEELTRPEGLFEWKPLATLVRPNAEGSISRKDTGQGRDRYYYAGLLVVPLALVGLLLRRRIAVEALTIMVPTVWYMLGPHWGLYYLGGIVPALKGTGPPIAGRFLVAFGLAMLAAAGAAWLVNRWRFRWTGVLLGLALFGDLWYWNSWKNPLAYARSSFDDLYGNAEEYARNSIAAPQMPLTRFDAPYVLRGAGPVLFPLDVKFETTYGPFDRSVRPYAEYKEAMGHNLKLRDGLNVSRYFDLAEAAFEVNRGVLPRAYFPKAVRVVPNEAASREALETLDPAVESLVFADAPKVLQDVHASAVVVAFDEQWYRVHYEARSTSLLKLAVSWYPGWRALVDRRPLPLVRVDHALVGAVVPAGEHEVTFQFQSDVFGGGAMISVLSMAMLAVMAWGKGLGSLRPKGARRHRKKVSRYQAGQ